ncbi:A/B/D/E cyclin [Trametes elegans]|nr:A/B/D/E cyclin [Trametes elegans]
MAVDPHPPAQIPSPKRFVAAREAARTGVLAGSRVPRRVSVRPTKQEEDEEEASRAYKKRRTSSDMPDVAAMHEEEVENAVIPKEQAEAEADPGGDEWDDLDAEDADDPLMVSEYVVEIFDYLKQVELTTMPNPHYMTNQKDLAWKMRGILTDWLIQVHSRFRLLPETLFLCVNIIDRFLSARVVSLAKLQLVGITCMFIAAKVEEIVAPSASNFLYCADSSYNESEILQAERYVLKTIDWNLSYPNPIHFLRRISKADDYNVQVRTIGKYLLEIQCLEWRLIGAPPSLLAAASIWLARLILGFPDWTPNLAHYSSYREKDIIPTANLMLNYIIKPVRHQSFYKKYASKKFLKASVFVREWALEQWNENTQIDLEAVLPVLKANIMEQRALEEQTLAAQANGAGNGEGEVFQER